MYLDQVLIHWINSLSGQISALDLVVRWITIGGPFVLVLAIGVRWWARDEREFQRHLAIACGLATALGLLFNQIILFIYHRPRPYEGGLTHLLIERSIDPSFPSDHATIGFAIAACLLLRKDRLRFHFVLFSILLCFSRVFVGTHYLTDVIGGAFTGILAALVVTRVGPRLSPLTEKLVKIC